MQFFVTAGIDSDKVREDARGRADKGEIVAIHYHNSTVTCTDKTNCEMYGTENER